MTNSKKRLEEILDENDDKGYDDLEVAKKETSLLADKILKEFVHKDNLPSVDKLAIEIFDTTYYVLPKKEKELIDRFSKAIRKLIEGKK